MDDHELVLRALAHAVGAAGIQVVGTAGSVRTAYRAALSSRADVVVVDNHLPDGSGADLCRAIRAARPDLAVILHSAALTERERRQGVAAGAAECLLKSIDPSALIAAVRRHAAARPAAS